MSEPPAPDLPRRPAAWAVFVVFAVLCLCWGTTFLAIREGVQYLPPALFGGTRVALGGLLLLGYLAWRREPLRVPAGEFFVTAGVSVLLFVGGNGLITMGLGEKHMESGPAAVLGTTTPLWMALLEACWPRGDRLRWWGWLGLLAGLGGVLVLVPPQRPGEWLGERGPFLVLASAFFWALGSLCVRYQRRRASPLATAAYQMLIGGAALAATGLGLGELHRVTPEHFNPVAIGSFFYLLVFGSLVGFLAYSWLLNHVPAALAGTYAYVTPGIAITAGWLLGGEQITVQVVGAMAVILASVALVRCGAVPRSRPRAVPLTEPDDEMGTSAPWLVRQGADVPRSPGRGR